jgi:hypothetical protein
VPLIVSGTIYVVGRRMNLEKWKKFVAESRERKPKIYFHVTSQDNEEGIRANGILGSKQAGDRDYSYSEEDVNERRVYLFSSQDDAYMAAFSRPDSGIFGGAEPPFVFVKVDLAKMSRSPDIHDDMELPEFEAYYIVGDVPPHAILETETEAQVADRLETEEEDDYNFDVDGDMLFEKEEYRVRVFEVELYLRIRGGVDQTLTDIRSIDGVTIVSSEDTTGSKQTGGYTTRAKIKFHPQQESMTGQSYVKQILIPTINSRAIPNCIVQRFVPKSLRQL